MSRDTDCVTVTVQVPRWIVEQIRGGRLTAVTAAAQLVEAAVLQLIDDDDDDES
jgi:hypothetical protein